MISIFAAILLAVSAHAEGVQSGADDMNQFLASLEDKSGEQHVTEEAQAEIVVSDWSGKTYYTVQLDLYVVVPADLTVGVGYETENGLWSVEAYTGVRLIRYVVSSDKRAFHIPYGARVQLTLRQKNGWRYFAEYQWKEIFDNGQTEGLLESKHSIGFGFLNTKKSGEYYKFLLTETVHHPWKDENHPPEKGKAFWFVVGKRFN